jgi:hypothetical protein
MSLPSYHPSYGYARPDEIQSLKTISDAKERDKILLAIKERTRKVKRGIVREEKKKNNPSKTEKTNGFN